MLGVPQPGHRACLALSCRIHSGKSLGTRAGCSVTSFLPHIPHPPAGGRGTPVTPPGRAGCLLCAVPGQKWIPLPALGRRESSADPDPRHRLCAGVGAAPAPARSQRLLWHQQGELLFKTMFSIRAPRTDCAFIVGGLLLRPGD